MVVRGKVLGEFLGPDNLRLELCLRLWWRVGERSVCSASVCLWAGVKKQCRWTGAEHSCRE